MLQNFEKRMKSWRVIINLVDKHNFSMKDAFQIFHHVFTIGVFITTLVQESHGFETVFLMSLMEISSIIQNCRGIAKFY